MNQLILDAETCRHFTGMVEPIELRDPSGKLLGQYTPHVPPEVLARYEKAKQLFELEAERPQAEGVASPDRNGSPLSEVWKRIRAGESGR